MSLYYTYILRSKVTQRLYKGHTSNLEERIKLHNKGKTKSTKNGIPWILIYSERFPTREQAIKRERYFKTAAGRRWIQKNVNIDI
ncbi:MAG: GIY-YIG nuclease family protein [Vicingaceae bacterium]